MTFLKFLFTRLFLRQLVFAVIALVVFCVLLLWWLRSSTHHGQKIEVPDLANMTFEEAEEILDESDLRLQILDSSSYNPNFPYKTVIEQIPAAGKYVKEDRKIYISLNRSGYPMIKVPDVVQKTRRQAEPTLLAVGFKIGRVIERPHISDQVLEIRHEGKKLEAGSNLQKTSVIDLVVGDGSLNRYRNQQPEENEPETEEDGSTK